jgi:hypothetical protein
MKPDMGGRIQMIDKYVGFRIWDNGRLAFLVCIFGMAACDVSFARDQPDERANAAETLRLQIHKMAMAITAPEYVGRDAEKDLELLTQFPAIRKLCDESENEYAKEIASQVQPYRNLVGTIGYARERIAKFEQAIQAYAALAAIREDADAILKSANRSVENQAPAYFKPGNDIDRRTTSMTLRLKVLASLMPDSKELKEGKELARSTTDQVRKIQMKLLEGILEQNELPSDDYNQADRKELLKLVEETWLKQAPRDKPIRIGLIGSDWVRTDAWEVQNRTVHRIDRSRIQGYVVMPNDTKTVVVRHIQLQRDHTNQDKLTAWSISDPKSAVEPMEMVLKSKLK